MSRPSRGRKKGSNVVGAVGYGVPLAGCHCPLDPRERARRVLVLRDMVRAGVEIDGARLEELRSGSWGYAPTEAEIDGFLASLARPRRIKKPPTEGGEHGTQ